MTVDADRVLKLRARCMSIAAIAQRLEVSHTVIEGVLRDHFDKPKGN